MRTKDIRVGNVYYVNVGGRRVEVRIIRDRGGRGRRYEVERTDTGTALPSRRAAVAIHADKDGYWPGAMEPREGPKGFGESEEEYEYPSDDEMYESLVISDTRGGRYELNIMRKNVIRGAGWDQVISAARKWVKQNQHWPNIYYVNERGNLDLLDSKGNILYSWV